MPLVIARRYRLTIFGWSPQLSWLGRPASVVSSTHLLSAPRDATAREPSPPDALEPDLFVGGETELERFVFCVRSVYPFELG
ncbi:MAG: hypothetical protein ABW321_06170 [Polyangiales bacterium]